MTRRITSDEFLSSEELPDGAVLEGADLVRAFWTCRGRELDLRRKQAFWEATMEALGRAYQELEQKGQELRDARQVLLQLNSELEGRVSAQVEEIVRHSQAVQDLNVELRARIRDRARELAMALRPLEDCEPPPTDSLIGKILGGRARVIKLLGRGGMGRVYLATDELTGREVALKVLHRSAGGKAALQRFIGEALAASAISHPLITRTIHIDVTDEGQLFQLMDYVPGVTIDKRLTCGAIASGATARLGATVAHALHAAHSAGVVHRDIKPSNLVLSETSPGLRILDFGIAKVEDESRLRTALTSAGQLVGTPHYMSPEQILDPLAVGSASDIYGLGATLFEMLAGRPPFQHVGIHSVFSAHVSLIPQDLRDLAGIPPALARLVAACLSKAMGDRPTALELAGDLDEFADGSMTPSLFDVSRDELLFVQAARHGATMIAL